MSEHTPGPWEHFDFGDAMQGFEIHHTVDASEPGPLAFVYWADDIDRKGEALANARLIAAAPELLAEAKSMRDWLQGDSGEDTTLDLATCLLRLEVAIQKAEGRTP